MVFPDAAFSYLYLLQYETLLPFSVALALIISLFAY